MNKRHFIFLYETLEIKVLVGKGHVQRKRRSNPPKRHCRR